VVSAVKDLQNGDVIEVETIGREGVVGRSVVVDERT
jgi:hypothetical protein